MYLDEYNLFLNNAPLSLLLFSLKAASDQDDQETDNNGKRCEFRKDIRSVIRCHRQRGWRRNNSNC